MPMKFRTGGFCVLMCALFSVGHAVDVSDAEGCQSHFTTEGNFLTGKKISTWVLLSGATKADVYSRVYSRVANDGWRILNADKDAGIISAAQGVSYGGGSQVPMTIVVEAAGKGSRVTVTFRTGGAQMVKEETIRAKLCSYLASAVSP
jgi:hypothetical protein